MQEIQTVSSHALITRGLPRRMAANSTLYDYNSEFEYEWSRRSPARPHQHRQLSFCLLRRRRHHSSSQSRARGTRFPQSSLLRHAPRFVLALVPVPRSPPTPARPHHHRCFPNRCFPHHALCENVYTCTRNPPGGVSPLPLPLPLLCTKHPSLSLFAVSPNAGLCLKIVAPCTSNITVRR